jgi:hypothetical protein
MRSRLLAFGSLCFILAAPAYAAAQKSEARVRQIILSTRHLGAHGIGYSTTSLWQLSKKLTPANIPVLISLASGDSDVRVGAQFGLASQCGASIDPVRTAATEREHFRDLSAEDTLLLLSEFEGCSPGVRAQAAAARLEVRRMIEDEHQRIEQKAKHDSENDARIQANGLKLLDPEQAKTLTREERLEAFHRSLAAMGLKEDGPMTPDQKKLVDRMYRSMVLGEAKTSPN